MNGFGQRVRGLEAIGDDAGGLGRGVGASRSPTFRPTAAWVTPESLRTSEPAAAARPRHARDHVAVGQPRVLAAAKRVDSLAIASADSKPSATTRASLVVAAVASRSPTSGPPPLG